MLPRRATGMRCKKGRFSSGWSCAQIKAPVEDCWVEREKSNLAQENPGNEGENYESRRPADLPDQEEQFGLFRQPRWRFKQHIADKPQLRNHALRPVSGIRNVKHPHRSAESHPFFSVILIQHPNKPIYGQAVEQERSQSYRA